MRLFAAILALSSCSSFAFQSGVPQKWGASTKSVSLRMSTEGQTKKKSLSAADILARARRAVGAPEEPEAEVLFNDSIMEDMKKTLMVLEKRAKEGPGSLDTDELDNLEQMTARIVADMDAKLAEGITPKRYTAPIADAQPAAVTVPVAAPVVSQIPNESESRVTDTSNDEGPDYDGEGGMGLAKGTRNTYVIPGMDEMSPEEYRAALQETISARQSRRHGSGIVGNRNSNDYLDRLSAK